MEELQINSWVEFNQIADHLDVGESIARAYAFRGHSTANWPLLPLFLRALSNNSITDDLALKIEKAALFEFKTQAHLHLSANDFSILKETISWWTVMQHHGAPTRLLDWTSSIYVATYFAVNSDFASDGAVILVHQASVKSKMIELYGDDLFPTRERDIETNYLQPNAPKTLEFVHKTNKSDREVAQQGLFSISRNILANHGNIMEEVFTEPSNQMLLKKLIIPNNLKKEFLKKLRNMNVTASSLFPGLDGLGKSVRELLNVAQ